MKYVTRHTGLLEVIGRLPSGANGNPRWLVRVDGWTCRTAIDSSLAYKVPNLDGKCVVATIGTHYGNATLDSAELATAKTTEELRR